MRASFFFVVFQALALGPAWAAPASPLDTAGAGVPLRIVSMVPSITETLFALGVGERVVGVSDYCDYPPEVKALPRVGTFVSPVAEAVAALTPDLILTSPSPGNESAVRALARAGVPTAVVGGDASLDEVRAAIARVAEVAGVSDRGRDLLLELDGKIQAVRAAADGKARPVVAVVVGHEPLILAGPKSYLGELVSIAGGVNLADEIGGRWPRVGLELLVARAPEIIIDVSMGGDRPPTPEALQARWASLPGIPAVAHGRIYGHRSFLLLRPGPRLGEAARAMAEMIHAPAKTEDARQ